MVKIYLSLTSSYSNVAIRGIKIYYSVKSCAISMPAGQKK